MIARLREVVRNTCKGMQHASPFFMLTNYLIPPIVWHFKRITHLRNQHCGKCLLAENATGLILVKGLNPITGLGRLCDALNSVETKLPIKEEKYYQGTGAEPCGSDI